MTTARTHPGAQLRSLLENPSPTVIMGAYDGLTARIAAEAGFDALWASGLSISTSMGVRDSGEASWSDLLRIVERMVDAAGVPVLVDADTGFGDFNIARRFAAQADRVGAAGICLEDKIFPKMNSFVGDQHGLAPVPEFCGKLSACRDAVNSSDFVIVARVEALIAGQPMDEALDRANAYRDAGADAIFIHSRQSEIGEIREFSTRWGARAPLVLSPTTYYATSPDVYSELGISALIWANQSMRATVAAVRDACRTLRLSGAVPVESMIAPLSEVFQLMDYDGLERDEDLYAT